MKLQLQFLWAILLFFSHTISAQVFYTLDFESTGGYTTSMSECTDGSGNYFTRSDGSNISGSYSNAQGSFFFAAMDTDGTPCTSTGSPNSETLLISGINISGKTGLDLTLAIAEDDDGSSSQDWDANSMLLVEYNIDGAGFQPLLRFEALGGTNTEPAQDTDFDGIGDGTRLTDVFQDFTASIPTTGASLDIRITFEGLDAGDEDVAIDNIRVSGVISGPTVGFDATTSAGIEGNSINIPVSLTNAVTFPVTLSVTPTNLTAEVGDYTLNTTTLTFTSNGTQNISVDLNQDADMDLETVEFTIVETTATGVTLTTDKNTLSITDDDVPVPTVLELGDLAIVAYNPNNGSCTGGTDVLHFVALKDITQGTTIDFTDNGWERGNANKFGSTEGAWSATYTNTTSIPAGQVFELNLGTGTDVSAANAVNPDWSFTVLGGPSFNLASNEQLFIMQGGTWNQGSGTHNASYDNGRFLFALNNKSTGWETSGGGLSTTESVLHPALTCANVDLNSTWVYYDGATTATTASGWFLRFTNSANWSSSSSCAALATDFSLSTITITPTASDNAVWEGNVNEDWFNCENWDTRRVPTATTNVEIPATAATMAIIDATATLAAFNGGVATCNNLDISGSELRLFRDADTLKVMGNLLISTSSATSVLNMDNGIGTAGHLMLNGNWDNQDQNAAFNEGLGTVHFVGGNNQTISTTDALGTEVFSTVVLNKNTGNLTNNCTQLTIATAMDFVEGTLQTTTANALVFDVAAVATGASNLSYVDGPVRKITSNATTTSFTFPTGKSGRYGLIGIETRNALGEIFEAEYFNAGFGNYALNSSDLDDVDQTQYWNLDDVNNLGEEVKMTLGWDATSNLLYTNIHVAHFQAGQWEREGTNPTRLGTLALGTVTSDSYISSFSPFTVGIINQTLPLDLLAFNVTKVAKTATLTWSIVNEEPNTIYYVERSADGINFETIGAVKGTGVEKKILSYSFLDNTPLFGENYYRIRMDEGGLNTQFTTIIAVNFEGLTTDINLYPSPATTVLQIELLELPSTEISLEVYNFLGQKVLSKVVENTQRAHLNIQSLNAGSYILRIKAGMRNLSSRRFIKQ